MLPEPVYQTDRVTVHHGSCIDVLKQLPDQSVQCCVTSPPYWGLRDYGVFGQLGLEETPNAFIENMVSVFAEIWRVMRNDGTLWLNLGDSYTTGRGGDRKPDGNGNHQIYIDNDCYNGKRAKTPNGLKPKDLIGIPWRVAFALQADGWYLRSDIIWHKPNPMPESVSDRPTGAHEYIFLLSKNQKYYYDAAAIKEKMAGRPHAPGNKKLDESRNDHDQMDKIWGTDGKRNKRTVWTVTTKPYSGAHFAVYPPELIEPCIKAGAKAGDTIIDPFMGSGTTGLVSLKLGCKFVGIELNVDYINEIAVPRFEKEESQGLLF